MKITFFLWLFFCSAVLLFGQKKTAKMPAKNQIEKANLPSSNGLSKKDEAACRDVLKKYVTAWLKNDSTALLALFEEKARLAPNGMCPVNGLAEIRQFWFPNDSSTTVIHQFENEIVEISGDGDLAFCAHKTWLDWSYFKNDQKMGKEQRGWATVVFKKQPSGEWKIWRQTWTDVWSRNKTEVEIGKPAAVNSGWNRLKN